MESTDSVLLKEKKVLYVFDFDGTLFLYDLLYLYLIYHFIFFNDRIFIIKSFLNVFRGKKLYLIRKAIFFHMSKNYDLNKNFKSFSKLFFLKYFIRSSLFSFLTDKYKLNSKILIITANYEVLVRSFLKEFEIIENDNFNIIGTNLPKKNSTNHDEIVKGKVKVKKIVSRLKDQKSSINNYQIHHFYDGYEDRYLCDLADKNIHFGNSIKNKRFFKKSYNALTFSSYLTNFAE